MHTNNFIHRRGLDGQALCGAACAVRFSYSGLYLTCPTCQEFSQPFDPIAARAHLEETFRLMRGEKWRSTNPGVNNERG